MDNKVSDDQWICGCDNKVSIRKKPSSLSRIEITQPLQVMPNTKVKTSGNEIHNVEIHHTNK